MKGIYPYINKRLLHLKNFVLLLLLFSSCTIPRKYQKGKPFVFSNSIEVKGGNFTREERTTLKQRLNAQLDDSSRIVTKDVMFVLHYIQKPPVFDTNSADRSARNMRASMLHLGYYNATASFKTDTIHSGKQQRIHVKYFVEAGKPTLIDTLSYRLKRSDLQKIAVENSKQTFLKENKPITKSAVLSEISRMVDLYRNNGYYKFTSDELRVRGDTTIEALTNISDDPFEQLQAIADAQAQRDSPKIKLALVLNPPSDSSKLKQYRINNIYILPDYIPGDKLKDSSLTEVIARNYIIRYHSQLFKNRFLARSAFFRKGDLYSQDDYYKTLASFAKASVWQSVNILATEVKDSAYKVDLIIQLIPADKFGFEAAIEAIYSANSNTNATAVAGAGGLIGFSGNVSLLNRNLAREGIKMTHTVSAGVELNKNRGTQTSVNNIINSNEVNYSNSIVFPKLVFPLNKFNNKNLLLGESFINSNISYINRLNLFDLQNLKLGVGYNLSKKQGKQWTFKLLNVEFSRLYNKSPSFDSTLDANPFLRYSFNTALVAGLINAGYSSIYTNPKNNKKQHSFKFNLEESGLILGAFFKKYMRHFVKTDVQYIYSRSFPKAAFVTKFFAGVGIPLNKDTTLPFFKQYFGGGSNSMRGWPVRGIGRGSQPLAPYKSTRFNDRTGDMQLEANIEYRYDIAQLIPNTLVLKGAFFADIGNIWNLRNSKPGGGTDSAQFKMKNIYKDLGVTAGTGFRLDFNYFILRFDLGFRFKRPETRYINDGWKIPSLSFKDVLPKLFLKGDNEEYRIWRYENFNFTIGIGYSF